MAEQDYKRRMPAQWEPHAATWLVWPHNASDWPGAFDRIPRVWTEVVRALAGGERVEILCNDGECLMEAWCTLEMSGVDLKNVGLWTQSTDRSWIRDSGPTAVFENGRVKLIGWSFNGWAKYKDFERDRLTALAVAGMSGLPFEAAARSDGEPLVLEGGGIETNGRGTLIVTEEWLLSSEQIRNPGLKRRDYEELFHKYLGITRTVWLGRGCAGDDTHGHVDDVARFASPGVVLLAYESDAADENHEPSKDNLKRLLAEKPRLHVVKLPYPRPIVIDGQRMPASYANFYIANAAVLMPIFSDPNDRIALGIIEKCFPHRKVVGIRARDLIRGLGGIDCLTQQQPAQIAASPAH